MSNASKWAAGLILCSFSLAFVACGDSSSGNDAGSTGTAGSGGGTGGASGGAGGGGASGTGGGRGGGSGTTGTGGGSGGNCQTCLACVQANCASQVTTCMANAGCNTIWQCATPCTMTPNQCIQMNPGGLAAFVSSVAACANTNCAQNGCAF